jgi:hypothetical protein
MNLTGKFGSLVYGFALVGSLTGALMLLTGFLLAANWDYGVHVLMVAYFVLSTLGTLGLLIATLTFWSRQPLFNKIGLYGNIETLFFSSALAAGLLFDKHPDNSPMIVGISRSMSIFVPSVAWSVIPVATSMVGTSVSYLRTRALRISEVTPWQQ